MTRKYRVAGMNYGHIVMHLEEVITPYGAECNRAYMIKENLPPPHIKSSPIPLYLNLLLNAE